MIELAEPMLGADVDETVHVEVLFLIHGEEVHLGEDTVLVASIDFATDQEEPSSEFSPACRKELTDVPTCGPIVDRVEDELLTICLLLLAESLVCWVIGGKRTLAEELV